MSSMLLSLSIKLHCTSIPEQTINNLYVHIFRLSISNSTFWCLCFYFFCFLIILTYSSKTNLFHVNFVKIKERKNSDIRREYLNYVKKQNCIILTKIQFYLNKYLSTFYKHQLISMVIIIIIHFFLMPINTLNTFSIEYLSNLHQN